MFFKRQPVSVYAAQMPMGDGMMAGMVGMPGMGGMAGMPGMAGMAGMPGTAGMAGMPGMSGMAGMDGTSGMAGMAGMPGMAGMAGMDGTSGMAGMAGMPGMAGMAGMPAMSVAPGMPGMAGAPGGAGITEVSGYAYPGQYMNTGMPGFEASGFVGPGMSEAVHAVRTEYDIPGCPPVHYGHTELDVEVQPQISHKVYVVRKGDTVYKIAKRYGLDWRELAGYNHLGNPNLIYPGQRLFIPSRF